MDQAAAQQNTGVEAVVIGRNEGARLRVCLESLAGQVDRVIYVDSGSTDGSVAMARGLGARVVGLDLGLPFTAARARNAGLALVSDAARHVQFVDGDCEVRAGWIAAGLRAFAAHPQAVVVCGRRRERHPDASLWNRLIDREWDTPVGLAKACGGDALMDVAALRAVGGYDEGLIAGEEPDLCLRLRQAGGQVWRIEAEMTWHDAALLRFGQWWRRTRRAGHAFAEGAARHGGGTERHWVVETRRALIWGLAVPLIALAGGLLVHPAGFALILLWPMQALRLARRWGDGPAGVVSVLGKVPESLGVVEYWARRLLRRRRGLIEYK